MSTPAPPPAMPSDEQRQQLLQEQIRQHIAYGWRIESQTPTFATVVKGQRPNHVLHLILTLLTCGLWGFVWIGIAIFGGEKRRNLTA